MADSDDEFDRRNVRDKFHHERNDYDRRDTRRGPSWEDRLRRKFLFNVQNGRVSRSVA